MENDKIISLTNLFKHLLSAEIIWMKNRIYITILNEKFQNQYKEQTKNKVPSNILSLYKASSWTWQLSLRKK